jgi:hypothetical protein
LACTARQADLTMVPQFGGQCCNLEEHTASEAASGTHSARTLGAAQRAQPANVGLFGLQDTRKTSTLDAAATIDGRNPRTSKGKASIFESATASSQAGFNSWAMFVCRRASQGIECQRSQPAQQGELKACEPKSPHNSLHSKISKSHNRL